jgi:hypothetical protein
MKTCNKCGQPDIGAYQKVCRQCAKDKKLRDYHKYRKTPATILGRYKLNAQKRHIPFELSILEFMALWQLPCYYCGAIIPTIGIDRVDNTKGYQFQNVVPCCSTCNFMKMSLTQDQFYAHIRAIINHSLNP